MRAQPPDAGQRHRNNEQLGASTRSPQLADEVKHRLKPNGAAGVLSRSCFNSMSLRTLARRCFVHHTGWLWSWLSGSDHTRRPEPRLDDAVSAACCVHRRSRAINAGAVSALLGWSCPRGLTELSCSESKALNEPIIHGAPEASAEKHHRVATPPSRALAFFERWVSQAKIASHGACQ